MACRGRGLAHSTSGLALECEQGALPFAACAKPRGALGGRTIVERRTEPRRPLAVIADADLLPRRRGGAALVTHIHIRRRQGAVAFKAYSLQLLEGRIIVKDFCTGSFRFS
jgi:hypothetical protein